MLIIVIENPIHVTIVIEDPFDSSGAFWVIKVPNNGESAITTNPQNSKKLISITAELAYKKRGETRQHKQESDKAIVANFLAPKRCENNPPKTHANPPDAIIMNDSKGTSRFTPK